MNLNKLILIICFVAFSLSSLAAPKTVTGYEISVNELLPIGYQLATENNEGAHTVFIFEENGDIESENQINIQFSIENKKIGLDWVLKAPRNIKEKDKFVRFVKNKGYEVELKEMNGVSYYRVERGGSLFTLCKAVITELYKVKESSPIGLFAVGISFK